MIKAVLFDIGDTLFHVPTAKMKPYLETLTQSLYEELRQKSYSLPPYPRYRRALHRRFVWDFLWSRLTRREMQLYSTFRKHHQKFGIMLSADELLDLARLSVPVLGPLFRLDQEAVAVVSQLQAQGYKLGLISNTLFPGVSIDGALQKEGLLDFFPVRVYSSDVGFMKPHREIFRTALDRMGVRPEQALYIGDQMRKDVKGCSRVGMKSALINRSGGFRRGRCRPDHEIRALSEVHELLKA
jgi:HAD superfamily hydrolase (TIGR01549 family)